MRKAERLFQIIQILRRSSRPVTSSDLADELAVSKRTVYRDIAHLVAQRVPIDGEPGFGYILDPSYDMPPLMLTAEEIEAVVLGVQLVARVNDESMRNAASDVMAKIKAAVPPHLLPHILSPAVAVRPDDLSVHVTCNTRPLRSAIREGRKIKLDYQAADRNITSRIVWPVFLGYDDTRSLLVAWCQSKQSFRHFRTERILKAEILADFIDMPRTRLFHRWQQWREEEMLKYSRP